MPPRRGRTAATLAAQHALHNQTALLIKGALLYRKNTVVANVPYLLEP
ncbi:MAG: hypothetical protein ACREM3_08380 [Candidatus Rokuibacteriota bacterium]